MKKRSSRHRARTFNATLLTLPAEDRSANSFRVHSLGRSDVVWKRFLIFFLTIQLPPRNSAESRTVQHVLIFDDHPESLRLVFGGATTEIDLSRPRSVSSRHLVLLSILIMGLLSAFLWLFF